MTDPLSGRRRAQEPTTWEKKHAFTAHRQDGFSLGVRTPAARPIDPLRNRDRNKHLPNRDFWIPGGLSPTDQGWK